MGKHVPVSLMIEAVAIWERKAREQDCSVVDSVV